MPDPINPEKRGLELLKQMCSNMKVGVQPHVLMARFESEFEVPLADHMASASATYDREDRAALERTALEHAAAELGRADARAAVAAMDRPVGPADIQEARANWESGWKDHEGEPDFVFYYVEYYKGYARQLADAYVRANDPSTHYQAKMEEHLLRHGDDLGSASEEARSAVRQIPHQGEGDEREWAGAVVRADRLRTAVQDLSLEAFLERVEGLAQGSGGAVTTDEAIQRVRMDLRREAAGADAGYSQNALLGAAWMSVPRSMVAERLGSVRQDGPAQGSEGVRPIASRRGTR